MDSWSKLLQRLVTRNGMTMRSTRRPDRRRPVDRHSLPAQQLEDRLMLSAWVTTDQSDYAPGQTAVINAGGFAVGETVALQTVHSDGTQGNDPAHQPWYVTDGGAGDLDGVANGAIQTSWHVGAQELGASLDLTATGLTSGEVATTHFTDADPIGSVVVSAQSGSLTYGTSGDATYTVTVNRAAGSTGAFEVTLDLTTGGLPQNISFSYKVGGTTTNLLEFGAADNSLQATLTITTATDSQAGHFLFDAVAQVVPTQTVLGAGTLDVGKKAITGTITATNKVYDGTTTATIFTRNLTGVINGDDVQYSGGTATFANKNAGNGKTVNAVGLSLTGTDAGNYTVNTSASTTANIVAKALTGEITVPGKTYDGTTAATITFHTLHGVVGADDVTYVGGTATFVDKNVGTAKDVNAVGLSLTGADAANYTVNLTAFTTADITAKAITGTITAGNKTYDGTTAATITGRNLTGVIAGDTVSYTGGTATFADKNVGNGKTVNAVGLSLSGADAGNYTVNTSASTTANITALAITGTITVANKTFDGTTAATITGRNLTGVIAGDTVAYTGGTATFVDPNVGNGKTVNAVGLSLTGADAGNYTVNTSASTTANITAAGIAITVTADANAKLVGAADPVLTFKLTSGGLLPGDSFSGALTRTPGEALGTYQILQGTLTAGANYNLTYVGANFQIVAQGPDISGPWTTAGLLTSIAVNGLNISFTDQNNVTTTGVFTTPSTVTGRGGLTGTIDTTTADNGRIVWSDGVIWRRIDLTGQYFNPANNLLTSVAQTGLSLTLTNASGGQATGTITGVIATNIPAWGQTATFTSGGLNFSGGSIWKKLDLSPNFTNATGDAVHVTAAGTVLTFMNKVGGTTAGSWTSPTTVSAPGWGVTGTVQNGTILWSNNTAWNKNLIVLGTGSDGTGVTSLASTNTTITLTNKVGGTSRGQITNGNTIVALDWGVTGTRTNGKIQWSNNTAWDNFDFNALDALFADIRTFPFGS